MIKLEDKLYTSTEVADILGVSLRSVYRYIEENKLQAEVKTATGRHRFTKQNIIDFLYPNGEDAYTKKEFKSIVTETTTSKDSYPPIKSEEEFTPKNDATIPSNVDEISKYDEVLVKEEDISTKSELNEVKEVLSKSEDIVETPVKEEVKQSEEPVDWLAKFREAAKKFEQTNEEIHQEISEEVEEYPQHSRSSKLYYRSRLGGLKDIAQNIDKTSRNSNVDYAFTLNSGLSLYKPVKPFSMLHSYIRTKDRDFFERILMLTPSDENNAQLCLIPTDSSSIFSQKDELHGLMVVSKDKLYQDIQESGDDSLKAEAEGILR